jgi:hypothetical protein
VAEPPLQLASAASIGGDTYVLLLLQVRRASIPAVRFFLGRCPRRS